MSSKPDSERIYYGDFSEGGFVTSEPTKLPFVPQIPESQDLAIATTSRGAADNSVAEYETRIRALSTKSAILSKAASQTIGMVRRKIVETLPKPALLDIGDNFYTGWLLVRSSQQGAPVSVFRTGLSEGRGGLKGVKSFTPYFLLNNEEVIDWKKKISEEPLDLPDFEKLGESSLLNQHREWDRLQGLSPNERLNDIRNFLDIFWGRVRALQTEGDIRGLQENNRSSVLELAIISSITRSDSKKILQLAKKQMESAGITALSTDKGAVIASIDQSGSLKHRNLPIIGSQVKYFQRYAFLEEKPLTDQQVAELYRELNPGSKLRIDKKELELD